MAPAVGFIGGMFGFGAGAAFGAAGGAAFGGWVAGAAFAGTLLGSLTVNLLGTVALSALSRAMAPEPEQGGGITISSTVAGETNPETIILGRYATGGQALCPPYSHGSSNRYLTHVIELCSAPGAQLDRIMLGDEWVELGASGLSEYGRPVLGDKYGGHVWVKYLDGSQTAADPMLRAKYGNHPERPWTADMVGHGLCAAILTFYYDQEVLAQVPRYRFEVTGIPVYDIRKDGGAGGVGPQRLDDPSTWAVSHNPIVLAWNIMRGIALPGGDVYGGNIRDLRRLPQAVWIAAMNRCDVPAEGEDGPEPMYRAGLEVLLTQPPATALEELFKSCSAVFADVGYGYGVTVGGPSLPVYSITDRDVLVSHPEERDPFPGLQDTWNAVTAKFPDPAHFWETRESPQFTNADYETADTFGRRMATLSLPAVPYPAQVQRMLGPWLEDERRDLRHNITVPPDSAHVELIDTLLWTSDHNLYDSKAFTIHEIVEDPFTALRQVAIREVDPADWVPAPDYLMPSPPAPTPPALIPATVGGYDVQPVTMMDGASKARRAGIRILWSPDLAGRGLRWRVRLAGQTVPVLHGTTQALRDGYVDLYESVLPVTAYQVQAELITDRPTVPTPWLPVTTDDVRLSLDDLTAEVAQRIEDLKAWLDSYPEERVEIDAAIQAVYDQALAALGVARDYLETGIEQESTARQAGLDALAAQVRTLTAVLNSDNCLQNPRFADGAAGWSTVTGSLEVVDRDEQSSDPITATAPTPRFAWLGPAGTGAKALQQTFDFDAAPGERAQWRVWLTSTAVIPVQVRCFWLDANGDPVGTVDTTVITIVPGEWRLFSGQKERPAGATRLRWNILRASTAGTTEVTDRLAVADASVTKVDVSLLARITDLEVVVANAGAATTLWQSNAESRFADTDDELDAVASALANRYTKSEADSATAAAITSVKSSMEGPGGSIKAAQDAADAALDGLSSKAEAEALGNFYTKSEADSAMATVRLGAEARATQGDLVLDGVFADGAARWPRGTMSTIIHARDLTNVSWQINSMPAPFAWRITPEDAAAARWRGTGLFPVTPKEEVRVSFDVARWSAACAPVMVRVIFYDRLGAATGTGTYLVIEAGIVAGRYQSLSKAVRVPDNAVDAEVRFQTSNTGATSYSYITNIRAPRGQEAYASGAIQITSEVAPSGAETKIGLRARAGGAAVGDAAIYLASRSDGTSQALLNAREFYVYDGALERLAFAIRDGKIMMGTAMADTLSIADGSVVTQWAANSYTLTITTSYAANLIVMTGVRIMGTNALHNTRYSLKRNGVEVDAQIFSVDEFTNPYVAFRALTVPAGTHTFDFSYIRYNGANTVTQHNTPRIAIFGGYR